MNIIWSPKSVKNLDEISDFISKDSPLYAPIFIQKVIKSIERLKDFPLSVRMVPEFNSKTLEKLSFTIIGSFTA